jgi:flagellar biosynthesis protein FliR
VRIAGVILFNPLLSRRNIPSMAKVGLIMFSSFIIAPSAMISENFYTDSLNDQPLIDISKNAYLVKGNKITKIK